MSRLALCSGRDLLQHDRFHRPNYRSLALRQTVIGWILAVILALAPWALPAAHAQPAGAQLDQSLAKTAGAFVPGHVLVGWNDLANKENAVASMRRQGWTVLRTLDPLPVALVKVPAGKELEAIALLEADPAVAYAETDALAFAPRRAGIVSGAKPPAPSSPPAVRTAGYRPNDPGWAQQWAPRQIKAHRGFGATPPAAPRSSLQWSIPA